MRIRWLLPAALVACLLAAFPFRDAALVALGQALVRSDSLERADLIYVLAGDFFGSRVLVGAELGAKGYAKWVLTSGGRYQDRYSSDMAVDFAVQHGYKREMFCPVRLQAVSTIEEARAMGPVFQRLGARRIILVTSNFHSRRAALAFRLFLPQYHFQMVGAPGYDFDPRSWWKNQQGRHLVWSEYEKIMGTLVARGSNAF
jgi:uncharacterized SAM-binding protein YcdF (DUF218 family)